MFGHGGNWPSCKEAEDKMDLKWGQYVAAHDVWLGRLYGVMLVKDSGAVTHLVVKRGLGRSSLRIIPAESIRKFAPEAIYTGMPLEEAMQQPILMRLDGEQFIVALTPKTRVLTADGKTLSLKGIRVSSERRLMEWLIVSRKLSRRRLLLPFDRVTEFTTGKVSLAMESSGLRAMPACRQDSHIEADLRERLGKAADVPQGELRGLTLTVEEGIVAFHGNVKSRRTVEALRDVTRHVKGAAALLMDVKADIDVELELATVLAEHTRGNGGPLRINSRMGNVQLLGHLPSDAECAELVRAANAVPGVHSVEVVGS